MRKFLCLFIVPILVLLCLAGCSSKRIRIEDYEWELSRVIVLEDETVTVIASNDETETSDATKRIEITLVAENGVITIIDKTNDRTYSGTYTRTQTTPAGTDYKITIDGKDGYACVAMTTYADGTQIPTLPISLGEYTLQAYAVQ